MFNTVWHEIFEGLAILCVLRELILAIRTEGFFLQRIVFSDFQKVQWKYIFSNNTLVCVTYVKPVKQIPLLCHLITNTNRHDFLVVHFCVANSS